MNYEKKYKEILEWARKNKARLNGVPIEEVLPELAESEDERMLNTIIRGFENWKGNGNLLFNNTNVDDILALLEKQKESLHIEETCKENPVSFTDKQEQKPIPLMNGDADLYFDSWFQQRGQVTRRQCFEEGIKYAQRLKEQKPAEWSEEDKEILDGLISLYSNTYSGEKWPWKLGGYITYGDVVKFLKSLRPQPHWKPSDVCYGIKGIKGDPDPAGVWKPSEEQIDALHTAVYLEEMQFYGGLKDKLRDLYEQLKSLPDPSFTD